LIDIGTPLDEKNRKQLPDIKGIYKNDAAPLGIDGLLISHPHMDHYGFIEHLRDDIPYYMGDATKKLIDLTVTFTRQKGRIDKYTPLENRQSFRIKSFTITPYLMDHSAFDSYAFLIEAGGKRLFYSGDFRASGWKKSLFGRFIKDPPQKVDCLLLEGTMIERQGGAFKDEPAVLNGVQDVLKKTDKKVVFTYCSGQNIDRIVTFYKAARRAKATLVIDPYIATVLHALKNNRNKIPQLDWTGIKVFIGNYYGKGDRYIKKIAKSDFKYLVFNIGRHKIKAWDIGREKSLVIMRDTMIPLVEKIPDIKGSTLIYSLWDGYIRDKKKAKVFWEFVQANDLKVEHIHTSGHADIPVLKQMVKMLSPKTLIPIHTQYPEKYKDLFENVMTLKDGEKYEI